MHGITISPFRVVLYIVFTCTLRLMGMRLMYSTCTCICECMYGVCTYMYMDITDRADVHMDVCHGNRCTCMSIYMETCHGNACVVYTYTCTCVHKCTCTYYTYIADRAEVNELMGLVFYELLMHQEHVQPLNGGTWE